MYLWYFAACAGLIKPGDSNHWNQLTSNLCAIADVLHEQTHIHNVHLRSSICSAGGWLQTGNYINFLIQIWSIEKLKGTLKLSRIPKLQLRPFRNYSFIIYWTVFQWFLTKVFLSKGEKVAVIHDRRCWSLFMWLFADLKRSEKKYREPRSTGKPPVLPWTV